MNVRFEAGTMLYDGFSCGGGGVQLPAFDLCELCTEPIHEDERSLHPKYGFKALHDRCFAGLCALERLTIKCPALKAKLQQCLCDEPVKFRAIGLSLVTIQKRQRSGVQRMEAVQFVTLLVEEISSKRKRKILLLAWKPFCAWYRHNWGLSDQELITTWKQIRTNPDTASFCEKEDGQWTVPVKMPIEMSISEKTKQLKQITNTLQCSDASQARSLFDKHKQHDGRLDKFGAVVKAANASASSSAAVEDIYMFELFHCKLTSTQVSNMYFCFEFGS